MGPPPKYLIQRKLVKRFFEAYLPTQPQSDLGSQNQLLECWNKHGIDHPECKVFEDALDNAQTQIKNYRNKLKSMKLKDSVMETFAKPTYQFNRKGRFEKQYSRENINNDLFINNPREI